MNRELVKTITDPLLLVGLMVTGATGVGLYLAPPGRIARATNWTWLGMNKYVLEDVRTYFGFAMLAIAVLQSLAELETAEVTAEDFEQIRHC